MNHTLDKLALAAFAVALATMPAVPTNAAEITLAEIGAHIDGTAYFGTDSAIAGDLPSNVDTGSFDFDSGLGSITMSFSGPGSHTAILYVDHEIDESINTFFNEEGFVHNVGDLAAGQSFEIDEPGWVNGDLPFNMEAGFLDNTVGEGFATTIFPDDVAMGLGYDFDLADGEDATLEFIVSLSEPTGGFYLSQFDPDSDVSLYFSSSLTVTGPPDTGPGPGPEPQPVPEPATIALFGIGAAAVARKRLRRRRSAI